MNEFLEYTMNAFPRTPARRHGDPDATGPSPTETLGQLTGQFAHDINNILAVTLTAVELAQRSEDLHRIRALLATAVESIQQQRTLTDAMAQASRGCECNREVDLHQLIEQRRPEMEKALGDMRLELRLTADNDRIECDPAFVWAAFQQLVANARSAMLAGGCLVVSTTNEAGKAGCISGNNGLVVTFEDNGCGIPSDSRAHVFDAFFGADEAALGLGLTQVRDTLSRLGGSAMIDSIRGRGTTVSLVFPLAAKVVAARH